MGAWIETSEGLDTRAKYASHPTWVRGLKHIIKSSSKHIKVAPYVGARIETRKLACGKTLAVSHPMWMRGLNLKIKELKRLVSLHHQGSYA